MGCNNCNDKLNCCHQSRSSGIETSIENCGCCCLIHERFTLDESANFSEETTVTIFEASDYVPACTVGQDSAQPQAAFAPMSAISAAQVTTLGARTLPFGTIFARNLSNIAFDFEVTGFNVEDVQTATVPPRATVAIFAPFIRRVDVIWPPSPIRALFTFDIFFWPPGPVIPAP